MNLNDKLSWGTTSYLEHAQGIYPQVKHAIIHMMKALGKAASIIETIDHNHETLPLNHGGRLGKMLADLVICSVRIANLLGIDLEAAVAERCKEKLP